MTGTPSTPAKPTAIVALSLLLLTAGCLAGPAGGPSEDPNASDTEPQSHANTTEERSAEPAENETRSSTNATANETAGNETEPEDEEPGPRTIQHAAGETTIDGATERVVALEFNHVENLLALGIQPAGVADKAGYEKWVAAGELDDDVVDVGTRAEPSLETIADLEPELIIAIEFRHQDIYDELSSIAPTLLFQAFPDETGADQYDRMLSILDRTAKATAHEAEGQAVREDMRQRFGTIETRLDEAGKTGREIMLSQLFTHNGQPLARVFLDTSIAANVAERIGLENAWTKQACSTGYGYCDVSKEGFADVQHADFFYQAQPGDDPVQDQWSDDPVWNSYEFVKEGRVYPLGADAWMFGGPLMSQELADRIAEHLLG